MRKIYDNWPHLSAATKAVLVIKVWWWTLPHSIKSVLIWMPVFMYGKIVDYHVSLAAAALLISWTTLHILEVNRRE